MSGCSGVHLKLSYLSAHIPNIPSDMSSIPCGAKMGNVITSGYNVGISDRKSSQVKKTSRSVTKTPGNIQRVKFTDDDPLARVEIGPIWIANYNW